jgi:hypothetical protein
MPRRARLLTTIIALAAIAASCAPRSTIEYTSLDADLGPLADAFNAQAGRVRVVMLVAPT